MFEPLRSGSTLLPASSEPPRPGKHLRGNRIEILAYFVGSLNRLASDSDSSGLDMARNRTRHYDSQSADAAARRTCRVAKPSTMPSAQADGKVRQAAAAGLGSRYSREWRTSRRAKGHWQVSSTAAAVTVGPGSLLRWFDGNLNGQRTRRTCRVSDARSVRRPH